MGNLSPIILFTYNRPWHTEQTLNALAQNKEAKNCFVYIYHDGAKEGASDEDLLKIDEVKKIIRKENRFKQIILKEQVKNKGLANSILDGVTEVIDEHGKVIVLEDDIKVDASFLKYMNEALDYYESRKEVFHINGFNNETNVQYLLKDLYFSYFMSCWGWATWKDRWDKINLSHNYFYDQLIADPDLLARYNYEQTLSHHEQLKANIEGKIKTWAILWYSTVFFNKGLCLTPKYSLVENIGMDGSGIHSGNDDSYKKLYRGEKLNFRKTFSKLTYNERFLSRLHTKLFYKYGQQVDIVHLLKEKIKGKLRPIKQRLKKWLNYNQDHLVESINCNKEWYGNDYGGFFVNPDFLNENAIVYSFGIGEDISFDKEIIDKHGAKVFGFDPTPKSINWIKSQELSSQFNFYDFGIDTIDGNRVFNLPINDDHVSGSVYAPDHVSKTKKVEVKMKMIGTIMNDLNHQEIDVLKMDIEGSEYSVIENILKSNVKVNQLLIEFHDRFFDEKDKKSKATIKQLNKNGYKIFGVSKSKEEVSFIHKRVLK